MPVIQTNILICEMCGFIDSKTGEIFLYSDPAISFEGWTYDDESNKLICPKCVNHLMGIGDE